jgi:hypothetical protein
VFDSKTTFTAALLAASLSFGSFAEAASLFDQSLTGAQMTGNLNVSFPTVQPIANGSSLDFGTGTGGQPLVVWNLLPAAPRGGLIFTIDVDYTPLTTDNDPHFGILAGGRYHFLNRIDNSGGQLNAYSSNITGIVQSGVSSLAGVPASGLGVVEPFRFSFTVEDEGAGAVVTSASEGSASFITSIAFPGPIIDTDDALAFVMTRASGTGSFSTSERYRLNSVGVRIDPLAAPSVVPLPAALPLLVGGLGMLAAVRRRRRS